MSFFNSLPGHFHAFVLSLLMFVQVLVGVVSGHVTVVVTPAPLVQLAATTSSPSSAPSSTTPQPTPATSPVAKAVPLGATASTPAPTAPTAPVTLLPTEELNAQTRASLINILCTTKAGGSFEPISGSGVIIDSRGVILTNAHVGQYFLLQNYGSPGNIQCVVRGGSPASALYNAELLYLPPTWVNANASQIISQQGMGTGENDYSFLLITGPVSSSISYPASFPALAMQATNPNQNEPVFLAAYPAGLLGGITIQTNLYASSALSSIEQLYTFESPNNVDLVSLGGTVVAQSGSSGGAVVNAQNGKLIGLIATESQGTTTASRDLNAITLAHVDRSLISLGLGGINGLLSSNLEQQAANFASTTASGETQTLEAVLNKVNN